MTDDRTEALRAALEPFREQAETFLRMVTDTADNVYPLREDMPLQGGQTVGDWANLARALTTPPAEGLDVERLARALVAVHALHDDLLVTPTAEAIAIARAYAEDRS
jgi:hypothetical protein